MEKIDIIAEAAPKRDYYYVSPLGRRLFQFALGPAALAFIGVGSVTNTATQHADSPTSPTTRDTCKTGAGSMLTASCGHNSRNIRITGTMWYS